MVPYSGIRHVSIRPTGKLLIKVSDIIVEGFLNPPGKRSQVESRPVEAAQLPSYEESDGGEIRDQAQEEARRAAPARGASTLLSASSRVGDQTLDGFVWELSQLRVWGLFHAPDAGFLLRVARFGKEGLEPYPTA